MALTMASGGPSVGFASATTAVSRFLDVVDYPEFHDLGAVLTEDHKQVRGTRVRSQCTQ